MANRDIVAIGASAGGIEALRFVARELSADFPAAILVTIHLSSRYPSSLDTTGPLAASFATDGEHVEHGRIYIAPAERHLLLDGDRLALGSGPRENHAHRSDVSLRGRLLRLPRRRRGPDRLIVRRRRRSLRTQGLWRPDAGAGSNRRGEAGHAACRPGPITWRASPKFPICWRPSPGSRRANPNRSRSD